MNTKPRPQRDVAGRQYLSKAELNALYFATYQMRRPRAWKQPHSFGQYWRSATVLFFNYGQDTGTIWTTKTTHEPLFVGGTARLNAVFKRLIAVAGIRDKVDIETCRRKFAGG